MHKHAGLLPLLGMYAAAIVGVAVLQDVNEQRAMAADAEAAEAVEDHRFNSISTQTTAPELTFPGVGMVVEETEEVVEKTPREPEIIAEVTDYMETTTTTIPGFDRADCPEIWDVAISVGWPAEWLPKLDDIVWAESNCTPDVISRTKDYGYTQINWAAHGSRLTAKGVTRDMLLDPVVNLTEALWIAEYARDNYGCWSQPWYMSGKWC